MSMHTAKLVVIGLTHDDARADSGMEYEGLSDKFHNFLTRATSSSSIFDSSSRPAPSASASQGPPSSHGRRVVLLEDLPNVLHPPTQAAFHSSLQSLVAQPASAPVVIIASDAGVRGEGDSDGFSTQSWKGKTREVVDVRTVLPASLMHSAYVAQISCVLSLSHNIIRLHP